MIIVMIGSPGSGKGTMSKMLYFVFGLHHISTGDLFRSEIKKKSKLGQAVKHYLDRGKMVPDEVTNKMMKKHFKENIILDGFPRTVDQARFLDSCAHVEAVIYLNVRKKIVMDRLLGRLSCEECGQVYHEKNMPPKKKGICDHDGSKLIKRSDQKKTIISQRLKVFEKETMPLVEYYERKKILHEISANAPAYEVYKKVETIVKKYACGTGYLPQRGRKLLSCT